MVLPAPGSSSLTAVSYTHLDVYKRQAEDAADLPEPAVLAREAVNELSGALAELQSILSELGEAAIDV